MKYIKLRQLNKRLYFKTDDLADALGIEKDSSKVACNRYVKKGIIIRLKKDFYILREKWEHLEKGEFFKLANFLQVPSYISFMTALSFYEITTQVQRRFFESACLKRSRTFEIDDVVFNFYKIKREYYFDFSKTNEIFIASKEKAFIDCIYLYSFGKYKIDLNSLDIDKLDRAKIKEILNVYPQKTRKAVETLCKI